MLDNDWQINFNIKKVSGFALLHNIEECSIISTP